MPLDEFIEAFTFTRSEPSGIVEVTTPLRCYIGPDYIFREVAISYLGRDDPHMRNQATCCQIL